MLATSRGGRANNEAESSTPERLVFTTSLLADRGAVSEKSVVTVTFVDLGDTTEMTFHAAGYTEQEERTGVQEGWSARSPGWPSTWHRSARSAQRQRRPGSP